MTPLRLRNSPRRDCRLTAPCACDRSRQAARAPADISDIRTGALGRAGIGPPAVEMHVLSTPNRGWRDTGHDAGKLGDCARDMVIRGQHDERAIRCRAHPLAGLGAFVEVLRGLLVDVDAAGEILTPLAGKPLQPSTVVVRLTTGDEKRAWLACGEQLSSPVERATPPVSTAMPSTADAARAVPVDAVENTMKPMTSSTRAEASRRR